MTCNNAHFNYPRSASISMQIKEVAIPLGCIEPRCEEKDALKNETGGEVKKEGKKKTRREVEWNNEEERKSEKNGNVGERKWRKKKGGNLRDRGMAFKRGGPFQVVWKLASFVFYTCICVTEVGGRD